MTIGFVLLGIVVVVLLVVLAFAKNNEDKCSDIISEETEDEISINDKKTELTGIEKKRMLEAEKRKQREKEKTAFNVRFTLIYLVIASPIATFLVKVVSTFLLAGETSLSIAMISHYVISIVIYCSFFFLYLSLRKKFYDSYLKNK